MTLVKLQPEDRMWLTDIPRFPDFPYAEWERRINRAKQLMTENKIDCLVVWKREDVRYFFGFQTTHWEMPSIHPGIGILPVDGDPILIVPDMFASNAQAFTWTRNIIYDARAHEVPNERHLPKAVADVVKEIGCGSKTIALESGYLGCMWIPRPLNDIETFKSSLPDAKFVDGDRVIWGCRMIKSPFEIERIRKAAEVITKAHSAIIEKFRPGMTEQDVAKLVHHVEVESGDFRGGDTSVVSHIVCGEEKEGVCDILALDDVMIGKNDYIQVDLQHKHKGYWADIARIFQVGPITESIKRGYELCSECLDNAASLIKPGVRVGDLFNAAIAPMEKAGVIPIEMAGHGIGLDIHEPPSIDQTNDMLLEPGMVFTIEPWIQTSLRRKGGDGFFGYEDIYVCTNAGYERIEGLARHVIQVSNPIW